MTEAARGEILAAERRERTAGVLTLAGVAVAPPGGRVLLRDVELSVAAGERVALVGPSGAGKTTLLRTLNGQVPPAAGEVRLGGEAFSALSGGALRRARREVALVAQKHDLVDVLPVHANVMAGALGRWSDLRALRYLIRPRAAELEEARAALDAVGLADKLLADTARLSGGEQQRVAIARALVQAPRALLADEPVASLDPQTSREMLELLTGLAKARGMALVCSLHQPELAQRYFDRVLELKDGRLASAGRAAG
jgi:phosphonate transport system ATP-binding protein